MDVDRARICGNCGCAMLFVSPASLRQLREARSSLRSDVGDG